MGCSMLEFIGKRNLIPPGSFVLCAVSGGADSVFLLRRLYELRDVLGFQLAAAHYNHHLRGEESDRDEAFVGEFVAKYCPPESGLPAVKLYVGGGDVLGESRRRKKGVEETAREMRYAFLRQTAREIGATRIAFCCIWCGGAPYGG
jgi:tRNA(Ile)-lysidine synthase TilS/MesJ